MKKTIFFVVAFILFACASGNAQTDLAGITGLVTDSSGAVIPGCQVEAKNLGTSATRTTLTNAAGTYSIPLLSVGSYEITASARGFQVAKSTVELALTGAAANFELQVASASTQVTVTASSAAVQLQTESHDVSQTVSSNQLTALPNNGRNMISTATLGPASQPGTDTINNGGDTGFFNQQSNAAYIAGLDNYHTLFLQDGVENISLLDEAANIVTSVESIQELQTNLNGSDARFAQPAVINVITKGGTNQFHGTAYDFVQNNILNARNFFAPSVPTQRYNLFGGNLGGRILKDKLFGFFDYSGLRNPSSSVFTGRVPTADELQGNLSGEVTAYDPATYDPTTGTTSAFSGNMIPPDRFNSFAKLWLQNYPGANTPLTSNNVNYITTLPGQHSYDEYLGRVDWNLSPKNQLMGSVVKDNPFIGSTSIAPGLFGIDYADSGLNINIAETAILSPTLVNVAKLGYNRSIVNRTQEGAGVKNYAAYYGLDGLNAATVQEAPPTIVINNMSSFGDPYSPQGADQNRFQLADEVNWKRGNHNIFFGGEFVRTYFYGYWVVNNNGNYTYTGSATGQYTDGTLTTLGNPFADFLLGDVQNATAAVGVSADPFRGSGMALYMQDNWKVRRSLTINIGLRYDLDQAPQDRKHHNGLYNVWTNSVIPGSFNTNYGDWGPRVGFAWNFLPRTVLRGGYGIYYAGNEWENLQFQLLYPPNVTEVSYNFSITNPKPIETAVSTTGAGSGLLSPFTMPKVMLDPSVQEWSMSLERTLGEDTLFTLAYIGNKSIHVEDRADFNQPYALSPGNTTGILDVRPDNNLGFTYAENDQSIANYNALVVKAERRFRNGFQFLGSYTWSKAMDLLDGDNGGFENIYHPRLTYAPSGWDRTNNFILSATYLLPIGTGGKLLSSANWFNKQVIGGWQLSGIQRLATGEPIAIGAANNADGDYFVPMFANRSCDPHQEFTRTRFDIFNGSCYVQPPNGVYGQGGRDYVREPRLNTIDLSLAKTFHFTERQQLEFRLEAFSAFNHPILYAGGGNAGTPGLGQVSYAGGQRIGQVALRYSF